FGIDSVGLGWFPREIVRTPKTPAGKIDAELILASRQPQPANDLSRGLAAGRGFQSLALDNTLSSLAGGNSGGAGAGGGTGNNDFANLPLGGAGAEGPTEAISISGAQGRTQDFGSGSEEELQDRIQEFRERMQREGGMPLGGGAQGPGGGLGGGPIAFGRIGGRGFNIN